MDPRPGRFAGGTLAAALVAVLTACAGAGDLSVRNDSDADVTVRFGDEDSRVSAHGGVVLLGYGCSPGDVTVELASGRAAVLPGPVCPEQEIVVRPDGTVAVQDVAAPGR